MKIRDAPTFASSTRVLRAAPILLCAIELVKALDCLRGSAPPLALALLAAALAGLAIGARGFERRGELDHLVAATWGCFFLAAALRGFCQPGPPDAALGAITVTGLALAGALGVCAYEASTRDRSLPPGGDTAERPWPCQHENSTRVVDLRAFARAQEREQQEGDGRSTGLR